MANDKDGDNSNDDNKEEEKQKLEEWRKKREARRKRQQDEAESNAFAAMPHDNNSDQQMMISSATATTTTAAQRRRDEQEMLLQQHQQQISTSNLQRKRKNALLARHNDRNNNQGAVATGSQNASSSETGQDTTDPAVAEDSQQQQQPPQSLLEQAAILQQSLTAEEKAAATAKEEEVRIMREANQVSTNALQAKSELAKGIIYTTPMPSSWRVPRYILKQDESIWQAIRDEWHMQVEGDNVPPPMKRFVDMKLPSCMLDFLLLEKKITRPTPIQMQGLPVALAGRDMVGIAFTGSGKTLTFSLPMVMAALEEELAMPIQRNEGPVGIVLAPSRELARQTYQLVQELCDCLQQPKSSSSSRRYPPLRTQLLIGGEPVKLQLDVVREAGIHNVVATPGRLRDLLKRRALNLDICRYICLDEADRMLDLGFDEEVGTIMNFFPHQRQTLLFSATFPTKFREFAQSTLVQPVVVNVGRAGAANLDVIQEVEYVKQEAKIVYLLHCLEKTAPPVIIFAERQGDVDDIHEYLLLKGVQSVSIHGGKDQQDRNEAIDRFKNNDKADVLIATDVAAKGLDFPNSIQHVICFDMPAEIENYVHRIGRTGRCGKTGVATTFINKSSDETTLLDLKGLLKEAKQRIPPVLLMLDDPREHESNNGAAAGGCSFCGGLGHTIVDCPKIDKDARKVAGNHKDALAGGGDW